MHTITVLHFYNRLEIKAMEEKRQTIVFALADLETDCFHV